MPLGTKGGSHKIPYENLADNQGHALHMHLRGIEIGASFEMA